MTDTNEHTNERGEITFRVRYPECDAGGIVYHGNYFTYFEMGRVELARAKGLVYRELEKRGLFFVVVKVECSYKSPARYDDTLTLKTTVVKRTRVKLVHDYELWRDTTLLATASITLALVNREGQVQDLAILERA
ncbi:MAG: acyl-CoA thioesterase [Thermoguttaceae bacterium]